MSAPFSSPGRGQWQLELQVVDRTENVTPVQTRGMNVTDLSLDLRAEHRLLPPQASRVNAPTQVLVAELASPEFQVGGATVEVEVTSPAGNVVQQYQGTTNAAGRLVVTAERTGDPDFGTWDQSMDDSLGTWTAVATVTIGAHEFQSPAVNWQVSWEVNRVLR